MENQRSQIKVAMNYGTLAGLSGVIVFLLFYFMGTDIQSKVPQWIGNLILIIFIVVGIKSYRDEDLGGFISYGKSLGTGILIAVFSGVVGAIFSVIFFGYIAPEMVEQIVESAQENMAENGMGEAQIEQGVKFTRMIMTPLGLVIVSILSSFIYGLLFSLIISIFTRKEQSPFNSNIG